MVQGQAPPGFFKYLKSIGAIWSNIGGVNVEKGSFPSQPFPLFFFWGPLPSMGPGHVTGSDVCTNTCTVFFTLSVPNKRGAQNNSGWVRELQNSNKSNKSG